MNSKQVRSEFVKFFEDHGHKFVPSAPVVPFDDPTLYFTNAGMNQFKNIFLNKETRDYSRAANSQKCMRVSGKHNDLEEVGVDTYHHTFFEMLGNWSFGDYYKAEAIEWAWELLAKRWELPTDKLFATVYEDDDEAAALWPKITGIPADRVLRFGKKDNFWEMGETGPCGPCSEIHLDRGEHLSCGHPDCFVNCPRCGRYIELWNLVFIQYNRDGEGKLTELPAKHVDTGMGFERITAVIQGVESNYDTDLFTPILEGIGKLCGKAYEKDGPNGVPFRVIADHARALAFTVADGSVPSNEGRGYVQRRILRRAARYGRKLGVLEPFLYKLVDDVHSVMGEAYPEFGEKLTMVKEILRSEEERFGATLDSGLEIFNKTASGLQDEGKKEISGRAAFNLYATYGFPVDLTRLMAREEGLKVDEAGFEIEMQAHKEASRSDEQFKACDSDDEMIKGLPATEFHGYDILEEEATILAYQLCDDGQIHLALDHTPFYATQGGQMNDEGTIAGDHFSITVKDVCKAENVVIHRGKLEGSPPNQGETVRCQVDRLRRRSIERNHTATHLLHAALHEVVGDHAQQSGSLVAPERLRFDFTNPRPLEKEELEKIEALVNQRIQEAKPVHKKSTSIEEAKEAGAMALFGEKYGKTVRMVQVPGVSCELCGGCHVENTGDIGYFKLLSEGSVAANIRRIEALSGAKAHEYLARAAKQAENLSARLNVPVDEVAQRVEQLMEELKAVSKEREELKRTASLSSLDELLATAKDLPEGRGKFVTASMLGVAVPNLREMADRIEQKLRPACALLASPGEGKVTFVCKISKSLNDKGYHAGNIVREVATVAGGKGGGRPDMATAGGKDPKQTDAALKKAVELFEKP